MKELTKSKPTRSGQRGKEIKGKETKGKETKNNWHGNKCAEGFKFVFCWRASYDCMWPQWV